VTVLLRRTIRNQLHRSRPEKSSLYFSEYISGFFWPAVSHLAASPSPRHEGNVGQAPSFPSGPRLGGSLLLVHIIHDGSSRNR